MRENQPRIRANFHGQSEKRKTIVLKMLTIIPCESVARFSHFLLKMNV